MPLTPDEHNQRVFTYTLAFVVASVIIVLGIGLFDTRVNNDEVFKVIAPAFQMIIGYFVGRQERKP